MEALEVEEEEEDLVEVEYQSLTIVIDNKDTIQKNIPNPSKYVSIANTMNILLKTALFYRVSGRKRDHN